MVTWSVPRGVPAAVLSVGALSALLVGCTPSTSSTGSTTVPATAPASTTTPASPATTATSSAATPSDAGTASTTASSSSTHLGLCLTSQLTATLGAGSGSGAGHQYPDLVLTNKGSAACTLTGYPGVSFVGDGNGTQLGASATRDAAGIAVTTLTLAPGASAHSQLSVANAGNYDAATCTPKVADGLRVYPPNQTSSLFVASTAYTACQNTAVVILQVRPLQAGAS